MHRDLEPVTSAVILSLRFLLAADFDNVLFGNLFNKGSVLDKFLSVVIGNGKCFKDYYLSLW